MPRDHTTPRCHGEFKHFKTTVLTDGIFLAGFDYFGKSVNVLNGESMSEWQEIVQFVEQSAAIKGVVFVSMKEGNFCAGADLEQMHDAQQRRSFQEIEQLVITAHRLLDAMGRSPKPFVAAVEGACLGGGLELVLACHMRIASTHPRTCFGLPEVKLGILPGFGGTQRLPRLIGLPAALDMITTGKTIFARQALRMGLVEGMVTSIASNVRTLENIQKETLVQAAIAQAHELCSTPVRRRPPPGHSETLERFRGSLARVSLCTASGSQACPAFLSGPATCDRCGGGRDALEYSGRITHGREASPSGSYSQPDFRTPRGFVPRR